MYIKIVRLIMTIVINFDCDFFVTLKRFHSVLQDPSSFFLLFLICLPFEQISVLVRNYC